MLERRIRQKFLHLLRLILNVLWRIIDGIRQTSDLSTQKSRIYNINQLNFNILYRSKSHFLIESERETNLFDSIQIAVFTSKYYFI
jgi:hypothetical protein